MARAVWRGTISFGMVSIPVRLYTATESQDISFRQLHRDDNSPIKYVKRCASDGQDLESDDIVKGYEYTKGQYVLVEESDLEQLPVPSKQTIELSSFVPGEEIDPIYYEKSYYVEPEEVATKPYALLARVLRERDKVGIGKLALRQKERLCALRPRDGMIQLETLYYADEVRKPEFDSPDAEVKDAELKVADSLVDLLADDFKPDQYKDEYREAVLALITAKLEGEEYVAAPEPEAAKPSVDLMAALKASVEAAQSKSGGESKDARKSSSSSRRSKAKASEDSNGSGEDDEATEKKPTRRRKSTAKS